MLTCSSLTFRINRMLAELWKKDKFGLKTVNHDIWRERERPRGGRKRDEWWARLNGGARQIIRVKEVIKMHKLMLITSSHKTATPSTRNVGNGFFLMFVCMFVNVYINRMNVWSQTAIDFDMKLKIQFISFEHNKLLLPPPLHQFLPSSTSINAFFMENGSPIGLLKNPWQHLSHGLIEWKNRPQKAITCNKTPSYFTGGGGSCLSHARPSNTRDVSMEIWFRGEWEREWKKRVPTVAKLNKFFY